MEIRRFESAQGEKDAEAENKKKYRKARETYCLREVQVCKPGRRHLMTGKTGKQKRQMRSAGVLSTAHAQRLKKALPYG